MWLICWLSEVSSESIQKSNIFSLFSLSLCLCRSDLFSILVLSKPQIMSPFHRILVIDTLRAGKIAFPFRHKLQMNALSVFTYSLYQLNSGWNSLRTENTQSERNRMLFLQMKLLFVMICVCNISDTVRALNCKDCHFKFIWAHGICCE